MNIHEYQAKEILKNFNVKIQEGYVANSPDEAYQNAKKLSDEKDTNIFVIKAQIHAGGRGKGKIKETGSNGVVIAKNIDDVSLGDAQDMYLEDLLQDCFFCFCWPIVYLPRSAPR